MLTNYTFYRRLFLGISVFMLAQESSAAIFKPTTNLDLIKAIDAANNTAVPDVIDLGGGVFEFAGNCSDSGGSDNQCFANNVSSAYGFIPSALPEITSELSIVNGRILRSVSVSNFRLISVYSSGDLTLFNVTLENGIAEVAGEGGPATGTDVSLADEGGCVYNVGQFTMQNGSIRHCLANDSGGAIYNAAGGIVDLQRVVLSFNTANAASAIDNNAGVTAGGGAIYNANNANINSIDNSTFAKNNTLGLGGGLNNQGAAHNIFSSTFSKNYCCTPVVGASRCQEGDATGAGGGIYNDSSATVLQIVQCTFNGNIGYQGGGIFIGGESASIRSVFDDIPSVSSGVYITNSTIAGNFSNQGGGGIYSLTSINEFWSNIVAGNIDTEEYSLRSPDLFAAGMPTAVGYNLIGTCGAMGGCSISTDDGNHDIVGTEEQPIDPELEDLDWNGGYTQTMALTPGSAALNNGDNSYAELNFDQRGFDYERTECGRPDIGAYEAQVCIVGDASAIKP